MFQVAIFTKRNPPMLQLRNRRANTVSLKISLYYSIIEIKSGAIILRKVSKSFS